MKRTLLVLFAGLLLLSLPCRAAIATDQILEITDVGGELTVTATQPVTFWEQPTLKAGETVTVPGKLTLTNSTDVQQRIQLQAVKLPYQDKAALEYLNHLHLTVYLGSVVVYDDAYSRINGENNLYQEIVLEAGASLTFTLYLNCDYTYSGTTFTNSAILDWEFLPLAQEDEKAEPAPAIEDPMLTEWLIAGVITVAILVGWTLFMKKRRS